jgi:hypothetical protein
VRLIVYSTLGLIAGTVVVFLIVIGVFNAMQKEMLPREPRISAIANPNRIPPEPRLQPHPANELQSLRRHEDDVLNHYGWVDQKAGVVRIPVDKAMDILARRGFPTKGEEIAGNANTTSR